MTDKKFTDEEIAEALECCSKCDCKHCPCYAEDINGCKEIPTDEILDLIKRQRAENERLQADIDGVCVILEKQSKIREQEHKTRMKLLDQINERIPLVIARANFEAVKGFAERVKAHTRHLFSGVDVGHIVDELVIQETEERTE